jgi:hypothetical protein
VLSQPKITAVGLEPTQNNSSRLEYFEEYNEENCVTMKWVWEHWGDNTTFFLSIFPGPSDCYLVPTVSDTSQVATSFKMAISMPYANQTTY